ncbi:hypothetical protein MHI24_21130 [Paenibacillus sp. FSL K6-1096]|uniref:hypothetical protein n=1 Tax=Paenibacillus sp. FSL K6-1096 TaxID=2921460 RepID=UPI0030EBDC26
MTIIRAFTLRNIMIILCIIMLILLGDKALGIRSKIEDVREAGRLYAEGQLIAAESRYRLAAGNTAIQYKEEEIASRLRELAPITEIRSSLHRISLKLKDQLTVKDFTGYMESYASLLSLKSKYMTPGGPYEAYYRQLSADSGLSNQMTAGFRLFKDEFLAGLAAAPSNKADSGEGSDSTDSLKWSLLQIPADYYGGVAPKEELLAARFESHDTARLKALAAAGSFGPMLDSALSLEEAYQGHSYTAPWIKKQVQASALLMLNKDLDGEYTAAFAGHAAAYRSYAAAAGIRSSKVLKLIDTSIARLLREGQRHVRGGRYAEALRLYAELAPVQDTSAETAAATLAWNTAEPVRLLPGGEVQGSYTLTATVTGRYGAKVAIAGIDSGGRLVYAALSEDGTVSTQTGETLPEAAGLSSLAFDEPLSAYSRVPVVVASGSGADGRTAFTGYTIRPEGISLLLSFSGSRYELMAEDGSIRVADTDLADGAEGRTAIFRQVNGSYEFAELYEEAVTYTPIDASQLELHLNEKVMFSCEIILDSAGRTVARANGRDLLLQGEVPLITGPAAVSGQFVNEFGEVETELGVQTVPVFVVDSAQSLSLTLP